MNFEQKNKKSIELLFNQIANNYDLLNNLMSFGLQKHIKKQAVKNTSKYLKKLPLKILDICTGTGDIAKEFQKLYPNAEIIGIDFSEEMLKIAKQNIENITFLKQDITEIKTSPLDLNSFDICFISFGLRNLPNIDIFLKEIQRYLKPNGILSILDLGKPFWFTKPYFFLHYHVYIPLIAKLINKDPKPYQYLIQSATTYPSPKELIKKLAEQNYQNISNINYSCGIIAQQICLKK